MIGSTPDQLATLRALVEEGSFEAAAQRLHVTQPAVSQRVKQLERLVGQVLVRRTLPVSTTAAGDVVLRYARQVQLLEAEAAAELGHGTAGGAGGAGGPASTRPVPTSVALAVNADSLGTWFLGALASLPPTVAAVFDLHREDQEHTTSLLRSGTVLAAVTSTREPVQGCSSEPLGLMRYRAVASPGFVERWLDGGGGGEGDGEGRLAAGGLATAPMIDFDRADDLQQRFLREELGHDPRPPRTFVPATADFARAVELGLGWGMLPEQQCADLLADGRLVDLAPGRAIDVALWWQRWTLPSPLLDAVTDAVRATAARELRPVTRPAPPPVGPSRGGAASVGR